MPTELHLKYRPMSLDKVIGAEDTVAYLKSALDKKDLPHAMLLHGPSGTGKTTIARIIKNELGCSDFDYRECNSASYRGIDSIREIQSAMRNAPMSGPCRVWLLDESHRLSRDAMEAALKMLEDTPSHVYFILATTDPQFLIQAIRTRCHPLPVRLLTHKEQMGLALKVARKEKIDLSDAEADDLAAAAGGSARMLLVLLEKVAHLPPEARAAAIANKLAEENEAIDLCRALMQGKPWSVVASILANLKNDPENTRYSILGYARGAMLKEKSEDKAWGAYNIIKEFESNFYDSKAAGLAAACYSAFVSGKK